MSSRRDLKERVITAGKRTAAFVLAALFLAFSFFPEGVRAAAPTVVRAGYFYNGDFMHKDDAGAYAGYDVEYYYTLAGYADWNVQFVEYDSLKSALAALERGEIDVMSGLSRTEERVDKYLVSAQKMCTAHIAVQTRADDDRFAAGDISAMADLTCGILKGSNVVTLYTDWCGDNSLTPHIVEYDSLEARNAALLAGEVDAIAGGSTIEGAQKIAEFPSLDLYFMFSRSRPELKSQLDRAMGILSLEDPTYAPNLFLKYFPSSRNDHPSFSAAEKAYIADHPEVRVALLADDAPFSELEKDGTVAGILPAYYAHLGEVTGLSFRFSAYETKDAACAALGSGEVDAVGKFRSDIFDANARGVILTVPYLKMNMVQITRAGTDAVSAAAVPECNVDFVRETLDSFGSSVEVKSFPNSEQSFAALKSGEADAVVCTQTAAAWLLNRNRASDYVVSAFGGDTYDVACAFAEGVDGNTLRSILNKTVAVDGGYMSQLITSGTLEDSADLAGLLDRLPVSLLAGIAAAAVLLLVVCAAALVVLVRRRRAEKRLEAQRAELAAAVEANKARHAFFGAVSHDMRTPLNGILGFTDLALGCGDPEQVRGYLRKIRTSGAVLNGLVNDTLVMSRLENGKYVLSPAPNDTDAILDGVLEPVRALAREKGVALTEDVEPFRGRRVLADRLGLQKILLNLLSNAVKFTPKGGAVALACRKEGGDWVLTVSDTGAGMSKEFLPHVFEPFAQEMAEGSDAASGSGIGLAIAKGIVDAMGGAISAESEKGRGTVFTVRLPLEELAEGGAPAAAAPAPETPRFQGMRALVCEDNEMNLEIIRAILERQGMKVAAAENGKKGVEAFACSAPGYFSVVLLDLRMPVMDGRAAARAIRALDRADAASVPIFAVSADAYPENVRECLEAGMTGHIAKPIEPERLYEALSILIK